MKYLELGFCQDVNCKPVDIMSKLGVNIYETNSV